MVERWKDWWYESEEVVVVVVMVAMMMKYQRHSIDSTGTVVAVFGGTIPFQRREW